MKITIRGTADTDVLGYGETRTVEVTPYIRGMIRRGLAVQVVEPRPAEPVAEPDSMVPVIVRSADELVAALGEQQAKRRRRKAEPAEALVDAQAAAAAAQKDLATAHKEAHAELDGLAKELDSEE